MSYRLFAIVLVMLSLTLTSPATADMRQWNKKMQELSTVMNELLPQINQLYETDKEPLEKNAKKLTELVHTLAVQPGGKSMLPPDADPSLTIVQGLFERDAKRAYHAIKNGHVDYGKGILRSMTSYCIACHSRNGSGPDFPNITLSPKTENLNTFEKAQLLAATRQFDGAIENLTVVVGDGEIAHQRPLEWNRAVKQGLMLTVRVKQDPDKALAFLAAAGKVEAPRFTTQNTEAWKASLEAWKKEKTVVKPTEVSLHRGAKKLLDQARASQKFPMDRNADVLYLRASAMLHDQLRIAPAGPLAPEAFYLLGRSYEVLGDLQTEPWHEIYYETCIRQKPHTALARSCFDAFESSIHFGYSGSAGFSLPEDVRAQMNELKKLAAAEKSDKK